MILGLFARIQLWQDLAMSLKAGYRIEDALNQAGAGMGPGARLARALRAVGRPSLAEAVASLPGRFSELEIAIVQAAEMAGRLPETVASLADYLKGRRKELGAMLVGVAYPVIVIHLAAFAGSFAPTFRERGAMGGALFSCVLALVPFYVITFLLFVLPSWLHRSGGERAKSIDTLLLKAPVVGAFFRHEAEMEFYWLMGTLLASGIPVREAVAFAAERCTNYAFRQELVPVSDAVVRGDPLAEALGRARIIADSAAARLSTAENTGNLAEAFLTLLDEATDRRSLVGRGLKGAVWGLYFVMAAIYTIWAVVGFYGGLLNPIDRLR